MLISVKDYNLRVGTRINSFRVKPIEECPHFMPDKKLTTHVINANFKTFAVILCISIYLTVN